MLFSQRITLCYIQLLRVSSTLDHFSLHNSPAAQEVLEEAKSRRLLILSNAEVGAELQVQLAYQKSMVELFHRLNITAEENKLSYMYVQALDQLKQQVFSYNYDNLAAFSP